MTVPSAARRRPAGRYDPPPLLGQRLLAVLLTVLVLAVVAAVGAFVWERFGGEQVRGQVRTFEVRSDSEVVLELEVVQDRRCTGVLRHPARAARTGSRSAATSPSSTPRAPTAGSPAARSCCRRARRANTAELAGCTRRAHLAGRSLAATRPVASSGSRCTTGDEAHEEDA